MSVPADNPVARGCYRRLLVVVRHGGACPAVILDYTSAWAMRDAVAHVAVLSDGADEDGGVTPGMVSAGCPNVATADAMRCSLVTRGLDATESHVLPVHAGAGISDAVAELAGRWGADIVLTDYPSPAHLAQASACNVLFLPTDGSHRFHVPPGRIFVASDDSAAADCAVEEAKRVAGNAELRRAYVSCEPEAGTLPGSATVVLAAAHHGDNLAHAILQAAREWGADLLVLGTHGPVRHARWRYGSVATAVALVSDVPLLLVPERS
ncbi:universal stress protein [Paraburkholderia bengalensis]|uniref:Universal stress protein n=1 Tax=Paraburkholderia bengalensis TaxID=2747562 RepID=A0ABU8J248_9BURK